MKVKLYCYRGVLLQSFVICDSLCEIHLFLLQGSVSMLPCLPISVCLYMLTLLVGSVHFVFQTL